MGMDTEQYYLEIKKQSSIYDSMLELANSKCSISCWQCPFVVSPHGTTCVKKMVRDLMIMNKLSKK